MDHSNGCVNHIQWNCYIENLIYSGYVIRYILIEEKQ